MNISEENKAHNGEEVEEDERIDKYKDQVDYSSSQES